VVRANGDRATNDGIRRFSVRGTVVSTDSTHVVLRTSTGLLDTVSVFGLRRLEQLVGERSRSGMVWKGALGGAVVGVGTWWLLHQTDRPKRRFQCLDDPCTQFRDLTGVTPPFVNHMRNAIPLFIVAGGLAGASIGRERWIKVSIPVSVFPQAR
jgi:hypothetical protein